MDELMDQIDQHLADLGTRLQGFCDWAVVTEDLDQREAVLETLRAVMRLTSLTQAMSARVRALSQAAGVS